MMKYKKRLIFIISIITIFSLVFIGCTKNESGSKDNDLSAEGKGYEDQEDELEKEDDKEEEEVEEEDKDDLETEQDQVAPVDNVEISIYGLNIDSGEIESITSLIPEDKKIDSKLIVDNVVEAMADISLFVRIDYVETIDDTTIISFLPGEPPVNNVGSGIEISILNAFAQSVLDNVDGVKKIIFRIEGEEYSTGHIYLEKDEVFLEIE